MDLLMLNLYKLNDRPMMILNTFDKIFQHEP